MYKNPQSRDEANRGRLEGGNSASQKVAVEKNQSKRGTRIAQGGSGGVNGGLTTGSEQTFGLGRDCGGNASNGDAGGYEKHGQYLKGEGSEYVDADNGRGGAKHTKVPKSKLVAGHDRNSTGNDDKGGREPSGSRKAERLDMATQHRFHDDE
jgi:hypothetical protein